VKQARSELVLKAIGRRIAELRRSAGWTQEQLAERIAVSPRYLQSVEAGRENLTVESLVTFANALKVSVPSFFESPTEREPRQGRPPKRSAKRG
jgi:transcriptional regulator with XRE-family HTH domain